MAESVIEFKRFDDHEEKRSKRIEKSLSDIGTQLRLLTSEFVKLNVFLAKVYTEYEESGGGWDDWNAEDD